MKTHVKMFQRTLPNSITALLIGLGGNLLNFSFNLISSNYCIVNSMLMYETKLLKCYCTVPDV